MWYGKEFNDGPTESDLEKRVRALEEREAQEKRDDHFTMTSSYGGVRKPPYDTNR